MRAAVRRVLAGASRPEAGDLVLVACSGGPDSVALLAAAVHEGPKAGLRVGSVTVDHRWSAGSDARSRVVAAAARELGADPVVVVDAPSEPSEDAARRARYAAIDGVAADCDAALVLLGHSLDDQAETVLLGLARGSGARSLAGMPPRRDRYARPLLGVRRTTLRAAAEASGLPIWDDPTNNDPGYTRARIRRDALPALEAALGPGVAEALARTAALLSADNSALDEWASSVDISDEDGVDAATLAALPAAVRTRALRAFAHRSGVPPGSLAGAHIDALDSLVVDWHGQGPVFLPTGLVGVRACGRLSIRRTP